MNENLRAGKGAHLELDEAMAEWLSDVLYDVYNAFGPHAAYVRNDEAEQELRDRLTGSDWHYSKDSYGHKMINAFEMNNGAELRVAVIVDKSGTLRLDIRTWFDPNEGV